MDGAQYFILDIKYFYDGTPIKRYKYSQMLMELVPDIILNQYNLQTIVLNGWIYTDRIKLTPEIKQA